jgi:uncharacterized protein (TIGR03435 family)
MTLRTSSLFIATLAIASSSAFAQPPAAPSPVPAKPLAYESVSVRPHGSAPGGMFSCKIDSCTAVNVPLRWLILNAYNIDDEKLLIGGPSWLDSANFDITAKLDPADIPAKPLTFRELEDMLQPVLADRFHLKIRHENRVFPVYNLTLAKGGSKLKTSAPPAAGHPQGCYMDIKSAGFRDAHNCATADIAQNMEHPSGRFVVDKTGLSGHYDYQFCYSNERTPEGDPNYECPGVFAAVQEQLGLKLEPSTAPIDILVIDSVEKPSEN